MILLRPLSTLWKGPASFARMHQGHWPHNTFMLKLFVRGIHLAWLPTASVNTALIFVKTSLYLYLVQGDNSLNFKEGICLVIKGGAERPLDLLQGSKLGFLEEVFLKLGCDSWCLEQFRTTNKGK